jgi:hypothetical protein
VFDYAGKLVHQGMTRSDKIDLRNDLGLPAGDYVLNVEVAP